MKRIDTQSFKKAQSNIEPWKPPVAQPHTKSERPPRFSDESWGYNDDHIRKMHRDTYDTKQPVINAVQIRLRQLNAEGKIEEAGAEHWYEGRAGDPSYIAGKLQEMGPDGKSLGLGESADYTPEQIISGEADTQLLKALHDAAGSEWWYASGQGR